MYKDAKWNYMNGTSRYSCTHLNDQGGKKISLFHALLKWFSVDNIFKVWRERETLRVWLSLSGYFEKSLRNEIIIIIYSGVTMPTKTIIGLVTFHQSLI